MTKDTEATMTEPEVEQLNTEPVLEVEEGKEWGIYRLTNKRNSKRYVGKSNDIPTRWENHIRMSFCPDSKGFQVVHAALAKYGAEGFDFEIIEQGLETNEQANEREIHWIAFYKCNLVRYGKDAGYNMTDGGEGTTGPFTEERKANISKALTGRKRVFTDDGRITFVPASEAPKYAKNGKVPSQVSPEGRRRISIAKSSQPSKSRGRIGVLDDNGKMRYVAPEEADKFHPLPPTKTELKKLEPKKPRVMSEEGRRRLSEAQKNREHAPHTEAAKQKIREANTGKIVSEATRQKQSKAKAGTTWVVDANGKKRSVPADQAHLYVFTKEDMRRVDAERNQKRAETMANRVRMMDTDGYIRFVEPEEVHLFLPPPPPKQLYSLESQKGQKVSASKKGKKLVYDADGKRRYVKADEVHLYEGNPTASKAGPTAGKKKVFDANGKTKMVPASEAHLYAEYTAKYAKPPTKAPARPKTQLARPNRNDPST